VARSLTHGELRRFCLDGRARPLFAGRCTVYQRGAHLPPLETFRPVFRSQRRRFSRPSFLKREKRFAVTDVRVVLLILASPPRYEARATSFFIDNERFFFFVETFLVLLPCRLWLRIPWSALSFVDRSRAFIQISYSPGLSRPVGPAQGSFQDATRGGSVLSPLNLPPSSLFSQSVFQPKQLQYANYYQFPEGAGDSF